MDLKYIIGIIVVLIVAAGAYMALGGGGQQKITIAGSTSVQPVAEKLAAAYMKEHPNVKINVQGGGSGVGIKNVAQGVINIGTSSKSLSANESSGLKQYTIGHDGIVIAVNKNNTVTNLNYSQLKGIFSGNITNWNAVGGSSATIDVITREEGSGTRTSFEDLVMNKTKIKSSAIVQSSTEAVKQSIVGDPNAVGFISLANLDSTVKAVKVNGVSPSEATVADGSYQLQRPFIFLTKGEPTGTVKDFIDWVMGPEGQAIVKAEKVVPASS
ncbi:phosphate ABC transporter substrate-binding protein [Methanobacterium congolense]|uniref:Phosphate-binding protein PstS 1 n=1 Tax=Methanobacterium congolense TaxID=118062 RepID=A0A1D3L3X4_9EURY|nr:phosphate ABC transporter substrate-binding protein [Methanobacterium congolense]SCG86354.1 Phosphate-binding protein PstS 1 [Methanobacterium congolense]